MGICAELWNFALCDVGMTPINAEHSSQTAHSLAKTSEEGKR
jgi:hypothetical protein